MIGCKFLANATRADLSCLDFFFLAFFFGTQISGMAWNQHEAVMKGRTQEVGRLLDGGADVSTRFEDQKTPLHYATGSQDEDLISA